MLKLLSKETVELIKSQLNIVDIVSEYVSLQRVGKNFRGLCPFHSEKTPSFYVNPEKRFYHCFGCGASGDVIKFVQEIENISFTEAIQKLAQRAGIELPKKISSRNDYYSKYVNIYSRLAEIYHKNVFKQRGLLNYLINVRKIDLNIIRKFKIGFCSPNSTSAKFEAKNFNLSDSDLRKFGLINSKGFDFHSGRLTFPVFNEKGDVVAFGSRTILKNSLNSPKYLNSPETPFFSKSREFFSSVKAFDVIKEVNFVIVVEGYFDVLALNVCGFENTLAPMGTALSMDHIKRISKATKNIILFFDSDEAGKKSTLNVIPRLEDSDFNIAVVVLKDFKDASEILEKRNQEHLKKYIENAIGYEEFLVNELSEGLDFNNTASIELFLKKIKPFALKMLEKRPVRYERLVEIINTKLGIRETVTRTFFVRSSNLKTEIEKPRDSNVNKEDYKSEIDLLIKIFLEYPSLRKKIIETLRNYRSVLDDFGETFLGLIEDLEFFSEDLIIEKLPEKHSNRFFKLLMFNIEQINVEKVILDCEDRLRRKSILNEISEIDRKLQVSDVESRKSLLKRRMILLSHLKGGKS